MSFIDWSEFLSVKVDRIDDQHKQLVYLINGLHKRIQTRDTDNIMPQVLDKVAEFASFHFSTEERLMEQHGFPSSLIHLEEHKRFVETVSQLQHRLNHNQEDITMETMAFLQDWLYQHLIGTDKSLGEYLNAKGVA
jgi:hemerythrin